MEEYLRVLSSWLNRKAHGPSELGLERSNVPVLRIPKRETATPCKTSKSRVNIGERVSVMPTALYRRLPSFTVGSRNLFPPNSLPCRTR